MNLLSSKSSTIFFLNFIKRATIELFNYGQNGLIFKCDSKNSSIIMKVCFLNDTKNELITNIMDFSTMNKEKFISEINIQQEVYIKTIKSPITAKIIYANSNVEFNTLVNLYLKNSIDKKLLKDLHHNLDKFDSIGIIGMEYLDGYVMIDNILTQLFEEKFLHYIDNYSLYELYKCQAIYILIQLAIHTGYNHNDIHLNNIMININDNNFFHNKTETIKGRPMIIDFGKSYKIYEDTMTQIQVEYKKGNYNKILELLCLSPNTNHKKMKNNPLYDSLCLGLNDYENRKMNLKEIVYRNRLIHKLIKMREYSVKNSNKTVSTIKKKLPPRMRTRVYTQKSLTLNE
jgi:hypothetical protein